VECNAYFQQKKLRETMNRLGIKLMAFAPLGSPGRDASIALNGQILPLMQDPLISELAKKYRKTNAQVLLRSLLQLGFVVIPKSVKKVFEAIRMAHASNTQHFQARISQNFDVWDFSLSLEEMRQIEHLDKGTKVG